MRRSVANLWRKVWGVTCLVIPACLVYFLIMRSIDLGLSLRKSPEVSGIFLLDELLRKRAGRVSVLAFNYSSMCSAVV